MAPTQPYIGPLWNPHMPHIAQLGPTWTLAQHWPDIAFKWPQKKPSTKRSWLRVLLNPQFCHMDIYSEMDSDLCFDWYSDICSEVIAGGGSPSGRSQEDIYIYIQGQNVSNDRSPNGTLGGLPQTRRKTQRKPPFPPLCGWPVLYDVVWHVQLLTCSCTHLQACMFAYLSVYPLACLDVCMYVSACLVARAQQLNSLPDVQLRICNRQTQRLGSGSWYFKPSARTTA